MAFGSILGQTVDLSSITSNMVKIETGSYVGTGTYGANNPNTLTFGFEPTVIFILSSDYTGIGFIAPNIDVCCAIPDGGTYKNLYQCYVNTSGNTVSWYTYNTTNKTAQMYQCNVSGIEYHYIAIGTVGGAETPTQLTARVIAADVSNPFPILKPRGITYEFIEQVGNQYRYSFTVTPGTLQLSSSSTATGTMGVKFEFIDATPSGQFEEPPYTSLQVAIPESNRVNGEYTFTCLMNEKINPFNNSFGFKVTPL